MLYYLYTCLPAYLCLWLSVLKSLCLYVRVFIVLASSSRSHQNFILFHLSTCLSLYLFCLSAFMSFCLSVCLSVCPCVSYVASSSSHSLKTKTRFRIQAESEFHGPASNTLFLPQSKIRWLVWNNKLSLLIL
jgi:hypothetical protein